MEGIAPTEILGWVAASLTLTAFTMRTMMPLRIAAIGASTFFILYGWSTASWPTFALHSVLLPFNSLRLWQLLRTDREAKRALEGGFSLDWIRAVMRPVTYRRGEVLFHKGDPPDNLYYLSDGEIDLEEIGITIREGELIGEIAFFTNAGERTLTARCATDCKVMVIRDKDLMRLHYQNPALGLYLLRLVANRLVDGATKRPEAYRPVANRPQGRPAPEHQRSPRD